MLKWILGFLKAPIANLVATLKTNRAENIAAIEAVAQGGGTTAEAAVTGFLASEAKKIPEIALFIPLAEPALLGEVASLVAAGTNTVPELYDAGVAFLEKEEAAV